MISIRENPGFYTGLGTGLVISFIIGKVANAYGYKLTGDENESSDVDTEDDNSEWTDEESVNSDEVQEVLNELGIDVEENKKQDLLLLANKAIKSKEPIKLRKQVDCKMVLVVRSDLKMGKGKAAAQCSHAAVGAYKIAKKNSPSILRAWERMGQPKIVTKVENEDQLLEVLKNGRSLNLTCTVIQDAGRTQIAAGSKTVVAVLGEEQEVDKVTSALKLY